MQMLCRVSLRMGRIVSRWWLGPWFFVVVAAVVVVDLCLNWLENELHRAIEIFVDQPRRQQ